MNQINQILKNLVADTKVMHSKLMFYRWNAAELSLHELESIVLELANNFSYLSDELAEQVLQGGDIPPVTMKECLLLARISDEKFSKYNMNSMINTLMNDLSYLYYQLIELKRVLGDVPFILDQCQLIKNNLSWLERSIDYDMLIPPSGGRVINLNI